MALLFQILFLKFMLFSISQANIDGFTTDFIHRDSPKSPYYDPSLSRYDSLRNAIGRSISRANRLRLSSSVGSRNTIESQMTAVGGEYLMKVSIGTPQVEFVGIVDTGSDLIWVQCKPCQVCFKQTSPIFDPKKSSSYRALGCKTDQCIELDGTTCSNDTRDSCQYREFYADGSHTSGTLSVEKLTIEPSTSGQVVFEDIVFGCGNSNNGVFDEAESGVIGLGASPISLVSQLSKSKSAIPSKFSYCLTPAYTNTSLTSQINFGSNAVVVGQDVVTTPLLVKSQVPYYHLTLEALSIGQTRLELNRSSSSYSPEKKDNNKKGNAIIDSGSTLTFLPIDLYEKLEETLNNMIDADPVGDPTGIFFTCYEWKDEMELPIITAHFQGADVKWLPINTFGKVSDEVVCLMILPTDDLVVIGNIAQVNFHISHDLEEKMVSFKPTECGL